MTDYIVKVSRWTADGSDSFDSVFVEARSPEQAILRAQMMCGELIEIVSIEVL